MNVLISDNNSQEKKKEKMNESVNEWLEAELWVC